MPETLIRPDATIRYWIAGDPEAPTVVFARGEPAPVLPRFMSQRPEVQDYVAAATRPVSKATLVAVTKGT